MAWDLDDEMKLLPAQPWGFKITALSCCWCCALDRRLQVTDKTSARQISKWREQHRDCEKTAKAEDHSTHFNIDYGSVTHRAPAGT